MSLHFFRSLKTLISIPQISMVVTMGSKAFGLCSKNSKPFLFLRLRTCTVFYEPTCSFCFLYCMVTKKSTYASEKQKVSTTNSHELSLCRCFSKTGFPHFIWSTRVYRKKRPPQVFVNIISEQWKKMDRDCPLCSSFGKNLPFGLDATGH